MPALEMALRFSAQRQTIIAGNVANISTPGYIAMDLSVPEFQRVLGDAIEKRRAATGGQEGPLMWEETDELTRGAGGTLVATAHTPGPGILAHDRNNRDLDRLMQAQAENALMFRVAAELLRSRMDTLRAAISERV